MPARVNVPPGKTNNGLGRWAQRWPRSLRLAIQGARPVGIVCWKEKWLCFAAGKGADERAWDRTFRLLLTKW